MQTYGYDAAKRLTNVTSLAGSFGYGYDPLRHLQVSRLVLPNGAFITNNYDSVARLLSTTLKSSQSTILNAHQYSYNLASQRTQQVFTATNCVNYAYDGMGQLISAIGKESGGVTNRLHEQLGYGYDPAGNLNFRTNNALRQVFTVNNLNELSNASYSGTLTVEGTTTSQATNVTVNAQTAALYGDATFAVGGFTPANGTNIFTAIARDSYGRTDTNVSISYLPSSISFTYDQNGNLTSDGSRCFAYDDENQLVSVWVTNVWRSDFVYDGKMRRRIRREYAWQSGAWTLASEVRYVYDGNVVIEDRDANNLPQVDYTRGRDLSGTLQGAGGIGGLLARTSNSQLLSPSSAATAPSFYHCDGNGNVTCLINSSQAVVARYVYDPYGNLLSQSGSMADANLYRFSSKEFHTVSGLVYYLYRFYDPNLQRWPNRDPLSIKITTDTWIRGANLNNQDGLNLYEYACNDPIAQIDPKGLWTFGFGIQCLVSMFGAGGFSGGFYVGHGPGGWSFGLLGTGALGAGFATLGGGGFVQLTTAPSVGDLRGLGGNVGGSGGEGAVPGGSVVFGNGYVGLEGTLSGGVGSPISVQGLGTYTIGPTW
jgi:RHS repeat-associated protein